MILLMKKINLKIFIVFGFILSFNFANAQVPDYARTPADLEILEGTSINFSGFVTFSDSVRSTKVFIDTESTTCDGSLTPFDEQQIDTDIFLPLGDYSAVVFKGYPSVDCSGSSFDITVESGSPAFSIIPIPVGNCDPVDKVCYYDWLIMNLVFLFLISTFIFTGFVSVLFPKKEKQEL